jgi:microcystin-dependent protein
MSSTPYDRQISFALFSAENPTSQQSGADLDAEFNAVKVALDDTQQNLALIQDDDGVLKRGSVGQAQFDSSVTLGFAAPAQWASGVRYDENISTVFHESIFYIANTTHTSDVSFDASKWDEIADFTAAAAITDGSITSAKLAAGAVAADKLADGVVSNSKLATGSVTTSKLAEANVTTSKVADAAITFAKLATDVHQIFPAGLVLPYAGTVAPTGWLFCYGQSLLRADYPSLFAATGTTFGAADGTHFNVPDMRGRVPAAPDGLGGVAANRLTDAVAGIDSHGDAGGAQSVTLTDTQMPAHSHGVTDPGHNHNFSNNPFIGGTGTGTPAGGGAALAPSGAQTVSITGGTTGITIQSNGGGGAHNNVQPTIVLNYIIKAH